MILRNSYLEQGCLIAHNKKKKNILVFPSFKEGDRSLNDE